MKLIAALLLTLSFAQNALARDGEFFCYEDDGSDLHINISMPARAAALTGEDTNRKFAVTAITEDLVVTFGSTQDCFIKFQAAAGGRSGRATFRCNPRKYPNALHLEMPCSVVKDL